MMDKLLPFGELQGEDAAKAASVVCRNTFRRSDSNFSRYNIISDEKRAYSDTYHFVATNQIIFLLKGERQRSISQGVRKIICQKVMPLPFSLSQTDTKSFQINDNSY